MSGHLEHFDTPQAAYDWARQRFSGSGFQIIGEEPIFPRWYLMSPGGYCMPALPKRRV